MVTQFGWSKACPNARFDKMYQHHQSGGLPKHVVDALIQARASNMDQHGLLHTSQCSQTSIWLYQYNTFPPRLESQKQISPSRPELKKHIPLCSLGSKLPDEEISHLPQICSASLSIPLHPPILWSERRTSPYPAWHPPTPHPAFHQSS